MKIQLINKNKEVKSIYFVNLNQNDLIDEKKKKKKRKYNQFTITFYN